jgi:hypothetical protein
LFRQFLFVMLVLGCRISHRLNRLAILVVQLLTLVIALVISMATGGSDDRNRAKAPGIAPE